MFKKVEGLQDWKLLSSQRTSNMTLKEIPAEVSSDHVEQLQTSSLSSSHTAPGYLEAVHESQATKRISVEYQVDNSMNLSQPATLELLINIGQFSQELNSDPNVKHTAEEAQGPGGLSSAHLSEAVSIACPFLPRHTGNENLNQAEGKDGIVDAPQSELETLISLGLKQELDPEHVLGQEPAIENPHFGPSNSQFLQEGVGSFRADRVDSSEQRVLEHKQDTHAPSNESLHNNRQIVLHGTDSECSNGLSNQRNDVDGRKEGHMVVFHAHPEKGSNQDQNPQEGPGADAIILQGEDIAFETFHLPTTLNKKNAQVMNHSVPDEVIKPQDRNCNPHIQANATDKISPYQSFSPPLLSHWQLKEGEYTEKENNGIVSLPPSAATTPMRSPLHKVLKSTRGCLEEIGHFTTLNPRDDWLPVTESRNGNSWYAGFHNMNASLGYQAILLPVAFTCLGWERGIFALTVAFAWQMYTMWLLIHMHECIPGKRFNRYLELCQAAFGRRLGLVIGIPIIFQLTVGTSTALICIGGSSLKLFYLIACPTCINPFSLIVWYLVFAFLCGVVSQLPNLNSIAGVSLIGAIMGVGYLTMVWVLSVSTPLANDLKVTYHIRTPGGALADTFSILNALGIIAFAFRGHNLVPEIQATMPSSLKHPAYVPMWRGARAAYLIVAVCYFPVAIGGYWAYGDLMNPQGILTSLFQYHQRNISRVVLGATYLFVVLSSISSFQIYSMSAWDLTEMCYVYRHNKPMKRFRRGIDRIFYIAVSYLVSIAFPFIADLAGFFAGIGSVPATFALPCFMFLALRKPRIRSMLWYLNWALGILGIIIGIAFSTGAVYNLVKSGLKFHFFKPQG